MSDPASLRVTHRFPVEGRNDPEVLGQKLTAAIARMPSGSADHRAPFGFVFRREPDVFSAISTGASLGMSILLVEFAMRIPYFSYVAVTLSAVFLVLGFVQAGRFVRNAMWRLEIFTRGEELVVRVVDFGRARDAHCVHADQIVAVLVVADEGGRPRVVLGGPRHALVAELYVTRVLDPERLAPWMAEMVALVAERASARGAVAAR